MNKLFAFVLAIGSFCTATAQDNPTTTPATAPVVDTLPITDPNDLIDETEEENRNKRKLSVNQLAIATRSKDHLLLQLGFDSWTGAPDSINTGGLPRSFNIYFMFDFPFKSNPRLSAAIGAGIGTSNMYFKDTYVDITGRTVNRVDFRDVGDTTHFKKFKMMTSFIEAPVELRYVARPEDPKKSFKAAIGVKGGLLLAASTKGKNLLNGSGRSINNYVSKEKSKRYVQGSRIAVTGRVGYGNLSLFGAYQLTPYFKDGFGPADIRPLSVGLTLSGL